MSNLYNNGRKYSLTSSEDVAALVDLVQTDMGMAEIVMNFNPDLWLDQLGADGIANYRRVVKAVNREELQAAKNRRSVEMQRIANQSLPSSDWSDEY